MDERDVKGPTPPRDAAAAAHAMHAYASARKRRFEGFDFAPEATQVLRREFLPMSWNVVSWDVGLDRQVRLMHVPAKSDLWLTVVVRPAAPTAGFAARIICHDRDLDSDIAADPDAQLETIALADVGVELESAAFDARYRLIADADQDPVALRRLLSPELIDWLVELGLADFSFELQDGALTCFVEGITTDAAELDALVAAAERIHTRAEDIGLDSPEPRAAVGGREPRIEAALDSHPFPRPPASIREAAKSFRRFALPFYVDGAAWRLGAEAFFRSYVSAIGMELSSPAAVKATHYEAGIIGDPVHVARGPLPDAGCDGWLLLCAAEDPIGNGWIELITDVPYGSATFAWAGTDDEKEAKERGMDMSGSASAICIWKIDEGPRGRTLEGVSAFVDFAAPLIGKYAAQAGPGLAGLTGGD